MSTVLDKARAFSMIAEHLPEKRRAKVAKHIASLITGTPKRAPGAAAAAPIVDRPKPVQPEVTFLEDHGFEGAELVRATARLTTYLNSAEVINSGQTREQSMRDWLDARGDAA